MRKTSLETYQKIKDNGLLSKRRMEVYDMLFHHGPLTANEIVRKAKLLHPKTNPSSYNARLSELKRYGLAIEVGEKEDDVSGNNCFLWDLTDNLPVKPDTKTKKQKKDEVETLMIDLAQTLNERQKMKLRVILKKVRNI